MKKHDSNYDSLVDCWDLVGCVSDNARSNGWLFGGRDLGEEVARKNYPSVETFKKKRRRKPKGEVAKRKSRRVVGDDVVKEISKIVTKSMRQLLMKGGCGDEIKEGLTTEWDYFPSEYN